MNECQAVTSAATTTVSVGSAFSTLAVGDRLLLLQVKDDLATASGDMADLDEAAVGNAGLWEIATVASDETSTSVTVVATLSRTYASGSGRAAQACRMPQYSSVSWSAGSIDAIPWDGETGGVVAMFVQGALTLDGASLNANDAGFGGGAPAGGDGSSSTAVDASDPSGAEKGEGIDGSVSSDTGLGNIATGGGGGNARCSGGGGGGGWGSGGYGGSQTTDSSTSTTTRGLPGSRVVLPLGSRLLMGGGGGGPSVGSDGNRGPGGNGGGVVLVIAGSIGGTAAAASADGEDGQNGSGFAPGNGASGGGAGGTIVVWADSGTFAGVTASGGDGGDAVGTLHESGPGGGGGGGSVFLTGPAALTAASLGGTSGTTEQLVPYGSTAGSPGVVAR